MEISQITTVQEIMEEWLEKIEQPNLKPGSYDRKENTCKWQVYPCIGQLPALALTNNNIEDMIQALLYRGYSYSTMKKAVEAVAGCYRYYQLHHKIESNPTDGVRVPAGGKSRVKQINFFNAEQIEIIQSECMRTYRNGKRIYPQGDLIIILINTGMRVGELLALTWGDVDLLNRYVVIDKNVVRIKDRKDTGDSKYKSLLQDSTKTSSSLRTIPLNNTAHAAFCRLLAANGKRGPIAQSSSGKRLLVGNVERTLKRVLQNTGFPEQCWYNVHALRHSFATNLLAKGADIKQVSEILGHRNVKITYDYYIHYVPKDYPNTVMLLDK